MTERGPWVDRMKDPVDEATVHRIWRGMEQRRRRGPRPGFARYWVLGGGAVVAAASLLLAWRPIVVTPTVAPVEAGALRRGGGVRLVAGERFTSPVELNDGSRIIPGNGAAIEVLENTRSALTLVVEEGRTRFEVSPGGPRRWTLECGLARVEVVGTIFTVDRTAERVRVAVERGTVLVRSPHLRDGATRVTRGAHVEVSPPDEETRRREVVRPTAPEEPRREVPEGASFEVDPAEDPVGRARSASRPLSEWLAHADEARAVGDLSRAEQTLVEGLALHPHDPNRALAWFTLGRVRRAGPDSSGAARAFDRALAEGLPRALVEEAMIRSVESHARAGESAAAARVARAHQARFPDSARRSEIDEQLIP